MNNGDLVYHTTYSHVPNWLDCDPCRCLRETDALAQNEIDKEELMNHLNEMDGWPEPEKPPMPDSKPIYGGGMGFRSMIGFPEQFPGIFFYGWGETLNKAFRKFKSVTGYKAVKHFIQRGRRGYSDEDLWDLNCYFEKVMSVAIPDFADKTHTYPDRDFESMWDWQQSCYWAGEQFKRLHEDNFWDTDGEEQRVDMAVYDWFNKYHASLWD